MGDENEKDYEVGYGKPPKATRFRKGASGNPKGRPRGAANFRAEIARLMLRPVAMTIDGKPKKVSARCAIIMRLIDKALKGEVKAIERALALADDLAADAEARQRERELTTGEKEILARYISSARKRMETGDD